MCNSQVASTAPQQCCKTAATATAEYLLLATLTGNNSPHATTLQHSYADCLLLGVLEVGDNLALTFGTKEFSKELKLAAAAGICCPSTISQQGYGKILRPPHLVSNIVHSILCVRK
ncbi:unnamed protein product [Ceratitis capitata]|uniref:(Mediterranean fruit fly) hypothetical protein n=1 Tax=Ceratitis capitata TaxID=7213 RepID=A0A811URQ1_CERCA|nr:unnamed protein product [Ceratitis capitata]